MSIEISLVPLSLVLTSVAPLAIAGTGMTMAGLAMSSSMVTVGTMLCDKLEKLSGESSDKEMQEKDFETKFADKNLLIKALKSISLCPEVEDNFIICTTRDYALVFEYIQDKYYLKVITKGSFDNVLNKYDIFKKEAEKLLNEGIKTEQKIFNQLKKKYICSDTLLKQYLLTYQKGY